MDVKIVLPDILASKKCEFYHQEQYLENYKELLFCVHCRFPLSIACFLLIIVGFHCSFMWIFVRYQLSFAFFLVFHCGLLVLFVCFWISTIHCLCLILICWFCQFSFVHYWFSIIPCQFFILRYWYYIVFCCCFTFPIIVHCWIFIVHCSFFNVHWWFVRQCFSKTF